MASIQAQKIKNGTYYYLAEKIDGKVIKTYLGTKPPIAKSRGWTNLSPEIVAWLRERAKQKTRAIPIPENGKGKYRTIVIDPPWPMERTNRMLAGGAGGEIPFDYPTMTINQITNDRRLVPVRKLANKTGSFIFLWITQKHLPEGYRILESWGFHYLFTMVWEKGHGMKPFNLPLFNCEFVLVGKRGDISFLDTKNFRTCFTGLRRNHSQKPKEFYFLLKRITPEPRLDIFSREKHKGFEQYGNETNKFK